MRRIAHIINPFSSDKSSVRYVAQQVTFETMRNAKEFSSGQVDVKLFSAHYPEDRFFSPEGFRSVAELDRSILDIGTFREKRKLPLLVDVMDRLYDASDAEYFVYTNVDIALMPYFYVSVDQFLNGGYDSFVINRRTIADDYQGVEEIPKMYSDLGKPHEGHDCFVFRRELHKKNCYGEACIGMPFIGRVLILNLACHARNFNEFRRKHLTFHIGNDTEWQSDEFIDYRAHNRKEFVKVLTKLEEEHGAFDRNGPLGPYLIDDIIDGAFIESSSGGGRRSTKGRISSAISRLIKRR